MTARDELHAVAQRRQAEIEGLYCRMLADRPKGHSVTLDDLQDREVISMPGEVESEA